MIESDLAVVIVNFNTGDYLERCLSSLDKHRGDVAVDVLVIDNASGDGSHRRAAAAHPWARLIENPENAFLSPAWNQGLRETNAPIRVVPESRCRVVARDPGRIRPHRVAAPSCRYRGPARQELEGTVYPSGRIFPGLMDALGHAFLGPLWPSNPFTRRYHIGRLGPDH